MICRFCGISFTTLISPSRTKICGSDDCKVLQNELKVISLSEGAKKGRQTAKDRGTFSGWKKRTKEPSYPEQYFIDLFNNENINGFEREHNVGRWFIDFAFLDKKIAIEIDGKQHQHRKHLDEEKDNFLRENGWTVFRIEWFNPINEKNRNKLYPKIKLMKEILGV
jgi:very-short-patch-repair endonuclease